MVVLCSLNTHTHTHTHITNTQSHTLSLTHTQTCTCTCTCTDAHTSRAQTLSHTHTRTRHKHTVIHTLSHTCTCLNAHTSEAQTLSLTHTHTLAPTHTHCNYTNTLSHTHTHSRVKVIVQAAVMMLGIATTLQVGLFQLIHRCVLTMQRCVRLEICLADLASSLSQVRFEFCTNVCSSGRKKGWWNEGAVLQVPEQCMSTGH